MRLIMTRALEGNKPRGCLFEMRRSVGGIKPRLRSHPCVHSAPPHAFFFTSLTLENTMPSARSLV